MRIPLIVIAAAGATALLSAGGPDPLAPAPAAQTRPAPAQRTPPAPQPEHAATGNLDKVDVPTMLIVVATATGKLTFHVQKDATIRQGSRTLTPDELARHKGERIKVRYREADGERHTYLITLAAPAKKT